MRALTLTGICVLLFTCFSNAKNMYHSFSVGLALPASNSSVPTIPPENMKKLGVGWNAAWTFFRHPFAEDDNKLTGLGFGGKISYSRWVRDSTLTPVTFLGVEALSRYYLPMDLPVKLFAQLGGGLFIGEYAFNDPDTLNAAAMPGVFDMEVREGKKLLGINFGCGLNWDVFEIIPELTFVLTKNPSIWLSVNTGLTF